MDMYALIAGEYDNLFPHTPEKTLFVEGLLPPGGTSVLDLGCATGELLLSLDREDRILTGIDLDGEMIALARRKTGQRERRGRIEFLVGEMGSHLSRSERRSRDMILCFGNTLAYLDGPEALTGLMAGCYGLLRPGGRLLLQVLNYDDPTLAGDFTFPDLRTGKALFSRSYTRGRGGKLLFHTALTDLVTGVKYADTHELYPFGSETLRRAAGEAGFGEVNLFGGYGGEEPEATDFARLYLMKK